MLNHPPRDNPAGNSSEDDGYGVPVETVVGIGTAKVVSEIVLHHSPLVFLASTIHRRSLSQARRSRLFVSRRILWVPHLEARGAVCVSGVFISGAHVVVSALEALIDFAGNIFHLCRAVLQTVEIAFLDAYPVGEAVTCRPVRVFSASKLRIV